MKQIYVEKEYELDGTYLPKNTEEDLREDALATLQDSYQDEGDEKMFDAINNVPDDGLIPYIKMTFNDPVIETGKYDGGSGMTLSATLNFDDEKFKKDFSHYFQ